MNWRKAAYALGGGMLGFGALLLSNFLFLVTSLSHVQYFDAGNTQLALGEELVVYLIIPIMICFGSMLTARSLGATWRRSFISGIATFVIAALVFEGSGTVFYVSEKLTFVFSAITVVLTTTLFRSETNSTTMIAIVGLAFVFVVAVFPHNILADILVPTLAWLLLPAVAGLLQKT